MLAYQAGVPPSFLFTSGRPNRCNPAGISCLYFAEDERTADAEYRHGWPSPLDSLQPRLTFHGRVFFRAVLDLENPVVTQALALDEGDLFGTWRRSKVPTRLQHLGTLLDRQSRFAAIRYPSTARHALGETGWNFAIFSAALRSPDVVEILAADGQPPLETLP